MLEKEWTLTYEEGTYLVTLTSDDSMLVLELEDLQSSHIWRGEFTSIYCEQQTQNMQNFKKFGTFVGMLISGFSNDNESLHIDIVSDSRMMVLKTKLEAKIYGRDLDTSYRSSSRGNLDIPHLNRRHVVLTYFSEFDKTDYPLSLELQISPNVESMKRTIRRLREQVAMLEVAVGQPAEQFSSDKERELKQVLAQLRQDNQELRHRMRQVESRASRQQKGGGEGDNSSPLAGRAANVAMSATNAELHRRVAAQEVELQRLSATHESLKMGYAKEVARWKMKLGMASSSSSNPEQLVAFQRTCAENEVTIHELKRLLLQSERECRSLRLSRGVPVTTNREALRSGYSVVGRSRSVTPIRNDRFATAANLSRQHASPDQIRRASSPSLSSQRSRVPSNDREEYYRRVNSFNSTSPARCASPQFRTASPNSNNNKPHGDRRGSPYRGRSPSPSSSLFGRFDPTEYQRSKEQSSREARAHRAWGAGSSGSHSSRGGNNLDRESGYESSHSQQSRGSARGHNENRRPSNSSNGYHSDSSNASSRASQRSAGGGRKTSRRKKSNDETKHSPIAATDWSPGDSVGVVKKSTSAAGSILGASFDEGATVSLERRDLGTLPAGHLRNSSVPPRDEVSLLSIASRDSDNFSVRSAQRSQPANARTSVDNNVHQVQRESAKPQTGSEILLRRSKDTADSIMELRQRLLGERQQERISSNSSAANVISFIQ